jgi:hypothetical protein
MANQSDHEMELMLQQAGQIPEQDARLMAVFSMEAVEIHDKSEKEGRPIFEEQEFITIYVPGDKDNVVFRPVRPVDKVRFREKYRAFKDGQAQPETGTPLTSLPFMSKAQVLELAYYGVRTAEQLGGMSDANGQKVMGWQQLRTRVKNFLDAASGAAPALKLQAELEKRDNEIASLRHMIEEMGKRQQETKKG